MITLQTFNNFATGTHNMGQLRLGQGGETLEKVNNHVHFTSKNNVRLTADENRAVRQAFVTALEGSVHGEYFDQLRELILGGNEASKCLNRDFVKAILAGIRNNESIDTLMATGRKLNERTFSLVDDAHNPVTSRKAVAYEKSVAEEFDACFTKAQEGIDGFRNLPLNIVDRQGRVMAAWATACKGVCNAVRDDIRLQGDRKQAVLQEITDLMMSGKGAFRGNALAAVTTHGLNKILRQELMQIFKKNFVEEEVAKDYIQRLFPDTEFLGYQGVAAEEALQAIRGNERKGREDLRMMVVGNRTTVLNKLSQAVLSDKKITNEALRNDISHRLHQLLEIKNSDIHDENSRINQLNAMINNETAAGKTDAEIIAGVLAFIRDDVQTAFLGDDPANADRTEALARYLTHFEMN